MLFFIVQCQIEALDYPIYPLFYNSPSVSKIYLFDFVNVSYTLINSIDRHLPQEFQSYVAKIMSNKNFISVWGYKKIM